MTSARTILAAVILLAPVTAQAQGEPVQTSDPILRGLQESDFPRLKQLEPNVYAYEELRPSEPGKFKTTVDLIVITSDGVLVADGQGNPAATQKLVAQIKNLTPLPIKYVVVCSEHEDHTGGNAAFKAAFPDVVFVASPVSLKALAGSEKAAQIFFERADKIEEIRSRKKSFMMDGFRDITPSAGFVAAPRQDTEATG